MRDFEIVSDLRQVRALAHADRLAILRSLSGPAKSGAALAVELVISANRVHYHLGQLEEVGLVREVGRGRRR